MYQKFIRSHIYVPKDLVRKDFIELLAIWSNSTDYSTWLFSNSKTKYILHRFVKNKVLITNVKIVTKVEPSHVHVDVDIFKENICTLMASGYPFALNATEDCFASGLDDCLQVFNKNRNIK